MNGKIKEKEEGNGDTPPLFGVLWVKLRPARSLW